jgi:hypothetical protein
MTAPMEVWVNRLAPLRWYHRLTGDGARTVCGKRADLYGHVITVGVALALSDKPCPACFTPRPAGGVADRSLTSGVPRDRDIHDPAVREAILRNILRERWSR